METDFQVTKSDYSMVIDRAKLRITRSIAQDILAYPVGRDQLLDDGDYSPDNVSSDQFDLFDWVGSPGKSIASDAALSLRYDTKLTVPKHMFGVRSVYNNKKYGIVRRALLRMLFDVIVEDLPSTPHKESYRKANPPYSLSSKLKQVLDETAKAEFANVPTQTRIYFETDWSIDIPADRKIRWIERFLLTHLFQFEVREEQSIPSHLTQVP